MATNYMEAEGTGREIREIEKLAELKHDRAYDFYFQGRWDLAESYAQQSVDLKPDEPRYRLLLAQCHCARDQIAAAEEQLRILRYHDPDNPSAKSLQTLLREKSLRLAQTRQKRQPSFGSFFSNMLKFS